MFKLNENLHKAEIVNIIAKLFHENIKQDLKKRPNILKRIFSKSVIKLKYVNNDINFKNTVLCEDLNNLYKYNNCGNKNYDFNLTHFNDNYFKLFLKNIETEVNTELQNYYKQYNYTFYIEIIAETYFGIKNHANSLCLKIFTKGYP
jgi:hypothetical protein